MKQSLSVLLAMVVLLLASCESPKKEVSTFTEASDAAVPENNVLQEQQDQLDRALGENELREYGRVLAIEDGVYPMFVVSVEFPEKGTFEEFNLNIEAVDVTVEELQEMNGRYVTLYYTSEIESYLHELTSEGKVILDSKAIDPGWKEVRGILEGADEETASDLPGSIAVLTDEGGRVEFPCYITPEMVEVNGAEVTAVYAERGVETITYLRVKAE